MVWPLEPNIWYQRRGQFHLFWFFVKTIKFLDSTHNIWFNWYNSVVNSYIKVFFVRWIVLLLEPKQWYLVCKNQKLFLIWSKSIKIIFLECVYVELIYFILCVLFKNLMALTKNQNKWNWPLRWYHIFGSRGHTIRVTR